MKDHFIEFPKDLSLSENLLILLNKLPHISKRGGSRKHGIHPGQWRVLTILDNQSPMTQSELLELLDIRPSSISELLKKLEEKEMIHREKNSDDKRVTVIKITEEGQAFLSEHKKSRLSFADELFEALTVEEQEVLRDLLQRLNEDWEEKYPRSQEEKKRREQGREDRRNRRYDHHGHHGGRGNHSHKRHEQE